MSKKSALSEVKSRVIRLPVIVFVGLLLMIVILAVLLWSTKRRPSTHLQVAQPGQLRKLIPSIVGLSHGVLDEGNSIKVLQNGAFLDAMLQDIEGARETVHFESYVWWKGEVCRTFANALSKKAREGVEVRVLLDASGSSRMDEKLWTQMEKAGCKVAKFHPVRFSNLGRLNNRDHRKIFIIDGTIGYVGGHGIAQEWTGKAQDREHWRDTGVRVEGPIVTRLQSAFTENWIEETGQVPAGDKYFPKLTSAGSTSAHLAYVSATGSASSVQLLYYLAISAAEKEIIIQNPYFLPDDDAIKALEQAVDRGVDVKIMMPSDKVNDSPIVQHASHHHFGTLLKRGVKVFEYEKTLLHQKIIVVDRHWSSIGSTNFDDRSFELNDEVSLGIIDEGIAAELVRAFEDDLKTTKQWHYKEWSERPIWHKMTDGLAFAANEQL